MNADDSSRDSVGTTDACRQPGCRSGRRCLGSILLLLLLVGVLGAAVGYWALFLRIYNLEVCRMAMETIAADEHCREMLGEPIVTVKSPTRQFAPNARVEERETDIRWHIQGPKGRAEARAHARRMQGKWEIDTLEVNGKRVAMAGDDAADAPQFTGSTAPSQKSDASAPPPEINLPVPPTDGPHP